MDRPSSYLKLTSILGLMFLSSCATTQQTGSSGLNSPVIGYSAELQATMNGITTTSNLTVQGECVRIEANNGRRSSIMIARYDKKILWLLIPSQNRYVEKPLSEMGTQIPPFFKPGLVIERERLGEEDMAGKRAVKSRARIGDKKYSHYEGVLWEDPAFTACPLKWQDERNGTEALWQNVKQGSFPLALFELPEGYKLLEQDVVRHDAKPLPLE